MPYIPTIAQAESNLRLWKSILQCYYTEHTEIAQRHKAGEVSDTELKELKSNLEHDMLWIRHEIESNQIIIRKVSAADTA